MNSIRTADIISKAFDSNDLKKEIVVELREYNENTNTESNSDNEKYIKENFSNSFVFSELNQKEIYENQKNSEDQIEWYFTSLLLL